MAYANPGNGPSRGVNGGGGSEYNYRATTSGQGNWNTGGDSTGHGSMGNGIIGRDPRYTVRPDGSMPNPRYGATIGGMLGPRVAQPQRPGAIPSMAPPPAMTLPPPVPVPSWPFAPPPQQVPAFVKPRSVPVTGMPRTSYPVYNPAGDAFSRSWSVGQQPQRNPSGSTGSGFGR